MDSTNITKSLQNKELELFYKWKDTGNNSTKLELMDSLTPIVKQTTNKFKNSGVLNEI